MTCSWPMPRPWSTRNIKKAFPGNFEAYKRACNDGQVRTGELFTVRGSGADNPGYVINPYKRHWRERSRIEYVRDGLEDPVREVKRLEINSLAVPSLGCGAGGLSWSAVRPLIEAAAARIPGTRVLVFEPIDDL